MSLAKQRRLVAEMLQEIYGQIDFLPNQLLTKLAPVLAQAQREIERELKEWLATEDGAARFTTQRLRAGLVRTRRAMERIQKQLDPELMRGLRIGSNTAGMLATKHVEYELMKFGELFGEQISPVALDTAAIVARGERLLVNHFAASTRAYSKTMRDRIGTELAVSRVRNETVAEATDRLQRAMPNLFRGERARAERMVRTELMNAYNLQHELGLRELFADDRDIRGRWDAYFDRRTCLQCASLDGRIIEPGGSFKTSWRSGATTFKSVHDRPPAHPNCRCVIVAWKKEWKDDAFRAPSRANQGVASRRAA